MVRTLASTLMTLSALLVAAVSLRYALPHPPAAPLNVIRNPYAVPWLPVHAVLSSVALMIGPFQVLPSGRRGWSRRHRMAGRVYVGCCLCSAPVGLLLASGATTGPVSTAGFGLLSVLWFAATGAGFKAARDRRFERHRAWMIRSYALTFAAVTLRLYLAITIALHLDFDVSYRTISFLCWVPNLVAAEVVIRLTGAAPIGRLLQPRRSARNL